MLAQDEASGNRPLNSTQLRWDSIAGFFCSVEGSLLSAQMRTGGPGAGPQERDRPGASVIECLHAPSLNPAGHSFIHTCSTHLWVHAVLYSCLRGLNKMLIRPQGSHVTLSRDFRQPRQPGLPPASSQGSRQVSAQNDGCSEKLLDDIQGTFSSTPSVKFKGGQGGTWEKLKGRANSRGS